MVSWNEREVLTLLRDALSVYFAQQAVRPDTLMGELEAEATAGLRLIQVLIDDMARQRRVWLANGMPALLADEKQPLEGNFSRKRLIEIQTLFEAFGKWLLVPLELPGGNSETPMVIVSRRGNPPEPVVTPVVEEPTPVEESPVPADPISM